MLRLAIPMLRLDPDFPMSSSSAACKSAIDRGQVRDSSTAIDSHLAAVMDAVAAPLLTRDASCVSLHVESVRSDQTTRMDLQCASRNVNIIW
jgi:hypothetical protein